jgi:hypothetical protein
MKYNEREGRDLMSVENGEWIMHGLDWNDPFCLHSVEELEAYIDQAGFLSAPAKLVHAAGNDVFEYRNNG